MSDQAQQTMGAIPQTPAAILETRKFTMADQEAFARLSGDFNPLHVKAVAARRLLFGGPVAHGIHNLLWAIDRYAAVHPELQVLKELSVSLRTPVHVGESITLHAREVDGGKVQLVVEAIGGVAMTANVSYEENRHSIKRSWMGAREVPVGPYQVQDEETLSRARGTLSLHLPEDDLAQLFPALSETHIPAQIAVCLATTRLVGMECPGMHSLYSTLDLSFSDGNSAIDGMPTSEQRSLEYQVTKWDPRFRSFEIAIRSAGAKGKITGFVRPSPVIQPSYTEIASRVETGEFVNQTALVIGGSRGLGEVTAKLVAAGGGTTLITYTHGQEEAQAVVGQIGAAGGQSHSFFLDVLDHCDPHKTLGFELKNVGPITHLYYFASPRILRNTEASFNDFLFHRYCQFYVTGLDRLLARLAGCLVPDFTLFYPSTALLDHPEPGFAEYVAAKAAGEAWCRQLQSRMRGTRIVRPRLARLRTDQTQGLLPVVTRDPVEVLHAQLQHLGT